MRDEEFIQNLVMTWLGIESDADQFDLGELADLFETPRMDFITKHDSRRYRGGRLLINVAHYPRSLPVAVATATSKMRHLHETAYSLLGEYVALFDALIAVSDMATTESEKDSGEK